MSVDYYDPKYRCCCFHITTGMKVICWLNLGSCFLSILLNNSPIGFISAIFIACLVSMPLIAFIKTEPKFIYPYFVAMVLDVLCLLAYIVDSCINLPNNSEVSKETMMIVFGILGVIIIARDIWFSTIAYRCLNFLREQQQQENGLNKKVSA